MSLLQIIAGRAGGLGLAASGLGAVVGQQMRGYADYLHMDKNTERGAARARGSRSIAVQQTRSAAVPAPWPVASLRKVHYFIAPCRQEGAGPHVPQAAA